jgi:hypothetical protein
MIKLDKFSSLVLLAQVVQEYGSEYRYHEHFDTDYESDHGSACRYAYLDKPACLVGHVLHRAGVTVAQLNELNEMNYTPGVVINGIEGPIGLKVDYLIDSQACEILRTAQIVQDNGRPWGEALEAATRVARELAF